MTVKLIQKQFLKGTREFEIVNYTVHARIKSMFKENKLTIGLSTLNPEPVVNGPYLEFCDIANSRPVLSLLLNTPDAEQFNAFVDILKQRVLEEGSSFAKINSDSQSAGIAANIYDEPPKFEEFGHNRSKNNGKNVSAARVEESIEQLEKFLVSEEIKPLLSALKALKTEPQNETCFEQMANAFDDLGIMQGAVLTYAPYISILLADDPFAD
jgi:hypothetical protein